MDSLFNWAEQCLFQPALERKLAATRLAWEQHQAGALNLEPSGNIQPIAATVFPAQPLWVEPRQVPQRKLTTLAGRIALLHAVAHIEFVAIHLAWDILYRFRHFPASFRSDWLRVAEEERQHFELVRGRLRELGSDYGDLPAHGGLWQLAMDTANDAVARLALLPRGMEAHGLDVTPGIIARLLAVGDIASVAHLEIILRDEIGHVALGSRWFVWECQARSLEPESTYFDLLQTYLKAVPRGPFNRQARLAAGFTASELARLTGPMSV